MDAIGVRSMGTQRAGHLKDTFRRIANFWVYGLKYAAICGSSPSLRLRLDGRRSMAFVGTL